MKRDKLFYVIGMSLLLTGCGATKETAETSQTEEESQIVFPEETQVAEEVEATEAETQEEPATIELVMVGDMLMHDRVINSGAYEDGTYNYDHLFAQVYDQVQAADLALVNQETILGGSEIGIADYPCFNSPYEVGMADVDAGFNVILSATNHALDKGKVGITNCLNFWEETYPDIALLGIHDSEEDQDEIYVYEQDGMKIAILNYTYGTNGISMPSDMPYCVDYMTESRVRSDCERANELADFVIVCPHWGTEYQLTASSTQKEWCQIFLECGVDLVIGTHPHVIEPIEWYEDEDGNRMLVYYSLGNFVNGTHSTGSGVAKRMVGGMADVTLGFDDEGQVAILDYGIYPLVCHEAEGTGYTVYYLSDYTEELANSNWIVDADPEFSLSYCYDLVEEVWGIQIQ